MSDHTRVADAAAGISAAGALTTFVIDALPWVQLFAGLVAIIAGIFAIRYHYLKAKHLE